ncbi:MmgE/PrpD family protein [uncultured Oscillibacter sp.]|uniref:MmgE/PrpD family protein n=1 Tax=uncultured Oscillibacter sp. TaxID=876091 RepID=UPI00262DCA39|nr:MmgE/PrpD family protein [uncultured Oscillibacter sp.]
MAVQPDAKRWEKVWGVTGWQIFAAILPIAVLYGFDARRVDQAIGMGCESSTLPTRYHLTTMSDFGHYEYGYRARDGFMVAKAVDKGIRNCRDALDESRCYRGIICGNDAANGDGDVIVSGDESAPTWFTRELGSRYFLTETVLRRWPAVLWVQAPAEAVARIAQEHAVCLEEIDEITVSPVTEGFTHAPENGYGSMLQAQTSIPFVVASALRGLAPGAGWYSEDGRRDPLTTALAKKVKALETMTECNAYAAFREGTLPAVTVSVKLRNGERREASASLTAGTAAPLEDAARQFRTQTAGVLSPEKAEEIIEAVLRLEDFASVAALSDRLFVKAKPPAKPEA